MLNKTVVCMYFEGETDEVFYNRLLDYIRAKSDNKRFVVEIKKAEIGGIAKFQKKLVNKFERDIIQSKTYESYDKIVILCYDQDVFGIPNQNPPVDRKKLEKELIEAGAKKVVHLVAEQSIEDIFLIKT